jgi:hypothetical protein
LNRRRSALLLVNHLSLEALSFSTGIDRDVRAGFAIRPASTSRRTASGRDGASPCLAIQASSSASSAGGNRTPTKIEPTGGRPRGFSLSVILDFTIASISFWNQKNGEPAKCLRNSTGSDPLHSGDSHHVTSYRKSYPPRRNQSLGSCRRACPGGPYTAVALAEPTDPIFKAIERHRTANVNYWSAVNRRNHLEEPCRRRNEHHTSTRPGHVEYFRDDSRWIEVVRFLFNHLGEPDRLAIAATATLNFAAGVRRLAYSPPLSNVVPAETPGPFS